MYTHVNNLQCYEAMWIKYISIMLKIRSKSQNNTSWSKQTQVNYIFRDKYIGDNGIKKMKRYYSKIHGSGYPHVGLRGVLKKNLMGVIYRVVSILCLI